MTRSRWTLVLVSGVVLAGVGFGALAHIAGRGVSAQSASDRTLTGFVPESSSLVGFVDVAAIAESPLAELLERPASSDETESFELLGEELGIDPLRDVRTATFSVLELGPRAEAPSRWGAALSGTFDRDRLAEALTRRDEAETEEHAGSTLWSFETGEGKASTRLAVALPDAETLLVGDQAPVRDMLEAGKDRSPVASKAAAEWTPGIDPKDAFWLAGRPPGALEGALPPERMPPLASFVLAGRVGTDLSLVARGRTAEPAGARQLAELLRGFVALGRLSQETSPELEALADSLRIDQEEDRVEVSLAIPFDTLELLLERRRAGTAK